MLVCVCVFVFVFVFVCFADDAEGDEEGPVDADADMLSQKGASRPPCTIILTLTVLNHTYTHSSLAKSRFPDL